MKSFPHSGTRACGKYHEMYIEHRRLFGRLFNTEQTEVAEKTVTSKDFYPINTIVSDVLEGTKKSAIRGGEGVVERTGSSLFHVRLGI